MTHSRTVAQVSSVAEDPLVTVVLLSYARPQYLAEALPSVVGQSYSNLEILVVDNHSDFSDEIAAIVGRYSRVRLLSNQDNLGFTGGMNLGIHASHGRYILLTEDDMVLDRDCIREFVQYATQTFEVGLLSGLILNRSDGSVWCAGGDVELGSVFRMKIIGQGDRDAGQFSRAFNVNYVPGSMIFASSAALKQLGGFREDFFMYCEDVELCFRILEQSGRITVLPAARASHFEPSPGPIPDGIEFHKLKNLLALYILHATPGVLVTFLFRYILSGLLRSNRKRIPLLLQALRATIAAGPRLWKERRLRGVRALEHLAEAKVEIE
jgi:GT2 family glycosyltransferase